VDCLALHLKGVIIGREKGVAVGRDLTLKLIEMAFSKLKSLLRKAAERTVPELWDRIVTILAEFSADECVNFFRHAGYA
jgi:hypothetical protein